MLALLAAGPFVASPPRAQSAAAFRRELLQSRASGRGGVLLGGEQRNQELHRMGTGP